MRACNATSRAGVRGALTGAAPGGPVVCYDADKMATSNEVPVEINQNRVCATEESVSFTSADRRGDATARPRSVPGRIPARHTRVPGATDGFRRDAEPSGNVVLAPSLAMRPFRVLAPSTTRQSPDRPGAICRAATTPLAVVHPARYPCRTSRVASRAIKETSSARDASI